MAENLIEKLKLINDGVAEIKPQKWGALPDIDLYMDQVLQYMTRQGVEINPEDSLTASMVSNYVKSGTMPGAKGKRYCRDHLAYLTAIQTFKQVLPVKDTKELIELNIKDKSTEQFYEEFLFLLNEELSKVDFASGLAGGGEADEQETVKQIGELALRYAISSYTNKLVCERLLYVVRSETASKEKTLENSDLGQGSPEGEGEPMKEQKSKKEAKAAKKAKAKEQEEL